MTTTSEQLTALRNEEGRLARHLQYMDSGRLGDLQNPVKLSALAALLDTFPLVLEYRQATADLPATRSELTRLGLAVKAEQDAAARSTSTEPGSWRRRRCHIDLSAVPSAPSNPLLSARSASSRTPAWPTIP